MSATDFLCPRFPLGVKGLPVKNTSGAAINIQSPQQGMPLVKLDTGNLMTSSQSQIGVKLTSAVTDIPLGFLIADAPAGAQSEVQVVGLAWGIADGAITAGALVGPSGTTSGDVTTYTEGDPYIGQALTAAVNAADPILVHIMPRGAT